MSLPPAFHESLPYIDPEPTPDALAAARALISAEQQSSTPPPQQPSTTAAVEASFSPAITAELERVASQTPLQPLTLSRYEAQETPATDADLELLLQVLSKAYVSDAYLSTRKQNLELLDKYGKNAWLIGNYHLEDELRQLEKELADTKREIDLVNLERQKRQEEVKGEMQMLDQTWRKGVGRVLETELAVEELKEQIRQEMKRKAA